MIKRFFLSLTLAVGLIAPAHAAGTISFSLSQQLDQFGKPLGGCKLYTIQAGTVSTPQNAFQDANLTLAMPNPMTCDAAGRIGQFFLADGSIKIRLTDKNGVQQIVADNILVIGPSSGGGGGGGQVDPTTVLASGDLKVKYGTGTLSGFVRANGRTIGSATSGATERANADTQALFSYLWEADPNLAVSSGRGASSAADWAANKTITLPDARGRTIAGLDDMGGSAAGRLTAATLTAGGTTLGASGGTETVTIARNQLPNVSPVFTGTNDIVTVFTDPAQGGIPYNGTTSTAGNSGLIIVGGQLGAVKSFGAFTPRGTVQSLNGGVTQVATGSLQPTIVMTVYIKL